MNLSGKAERFLFSDIVSKNKREIIKAPNQMMILNPDGREVALLQNNPDEFYRYAYDLANSTGSNPAVSNLKVYLAFKPIRISVMW